MGLSVMESVQTQRYAVLNGIGAVQQWIIVLLLGHVDMGSVGMASAQTKAYAVLHGFGVVPRRSTVPILLEPVGTEIVEMLSALTKRYAVLNRDTAAREPAIVYEVHVSRP